MSIETIKKRHERMVEDHGGKLRFVLKVYQDRATLLRIIERVEGLVEKWRFDEKVSCGYGGARRTATNCADELAALLRYTAPPENEE